MSTSRFAVLGSPVDHSKSPLLHNAAYEYLGISGTYTAIDVQKGELENFLRQQGRNFDAFSITMPLKEEAFRVAFEQDRIAASIQVANTLIRDGEFWQASNTDVLGFLEIFKRHFASDLDAPVVLGSGSTAKSAILALSALGVRAITLMARNHRTAEEMQQLFPALNITYLNWNGEITAGSLVVSAVPEVTNLKCAAAITNFLDVTYKDASASLIKAIGAPSYRLIDGLHLLVYQAAYQVLAMRSIDGDLFEEICDVMFKALVPSN